MDEKMKSEVLIALEGVSLGYGNSTVLRGVDLEVRRGDFLGLVGPNGAGKTTLLRGIIGLLKPLAGRIRVGASPGQRARPEPRIGGPEPNGQTPDAELADNGRRAIVLGYVPQVQELDAIYPLTVREVVRMGGYHRTPPLRPMGAHEDRFLEYCLDEVGMARVARKQFNRLSGGQKQRVLIARALFTKPDMLLLDEPTSGADHEAEKKVMALLDCLNREGHTILLICHELDAVQRAVKEILWVQGGRVRRDSPSRLLSENVVREMYREE